jgi:hypothetical protein
LIFAAGLLIVAGLSSCAFLNGLLGSSTSSSGGGRSVSSLIHASEGGKLELAGASLSIPPGALSGDANVTLSDRGKPQHPADDPLDFVSDAFRVDASGVSGAPVTLVTPADLTLTPDPSSLGNTLDLIVGDTDPDQASITSLHRAQPAWDKSSSRVSHPYTKLTLSQWVIRIPPLQPQPHEGSILQVPWYYQSGLPWCVPTSLTEMLRYFDFSENSGDPLNPSLGQTTAFANWQTAAQSHQPAGSGAGYDELTNVGIDVAHTIQYLWDDDFLITAGGAHGNFADFETYVVLASTGLFGLFDRKPIMLAVDMWWHSVVIVGVDGSGLFIHDSNGPIAEHFTWEGFQDAARGMKTDSEGHSVYVHTLYTAIVTGVPIKPETKRRGSVVIGRSDLSFQTQSSTTAALDWDGQYHPHGYFFNDSTLASAADFGVAADRSKSFNYQYRIANVTNISLTFNSVAELSGPNYGDALQSQPHSTTVPPYSLSSFITGTFSEPFSGSGAIFDVKLYAIDDNSTVQDFKFVRYNVTGLPVIIALPPIQLPPVSLVPTAVPGGPYEADAQRSQIGFGATIDLDGTKSTAPAGRQLIRYDWDFGDDSSGEGYKVIHFYAGNAREPSVEYRACLTVTDNMGGTNQACTQVKINTAPAANSFSVTSVEASVKPTAARQCPAEFNFTGSITTNGAGSVTYRWERSDGGMGIVQTLSFAGAGTQTLTNSWTLSPPGANTYWEVVHVLTPNDMTSSQATFTLMCPVPAE